MTHATPANDRELVIVREFQAPRSLFWKAWTDPKHITQWFGPRGFTTRVDAYDFRVGGKWAYTMIGPDKAEYPCNGVFSEIVPIERIVTTDEFGEDMLKQHPDENFPRGMVVTCLFDDLGARTRLTVRIMHRSVQDRINHEKMGVVAGWGSTFDCLDDHLASLCN